MSKWEMVRLEQVCEILDSKRVPITSSDRISGEYPYYGANGIQDYINDYIFDDELVLVAEDGGNFGSKDKPIAYRVSGKSWVNNHAHVLKAKENLNVDFLCYSLMFYDVSDIINGATRQKLNQAALRKMKIPFPPLQEQNKIAAELDKISDLIAKRKQQIEKLDVLVKAKFIEMFGDPVTNPMGWEKVNLKEAAEIKIGPFGSLLHKEDYICNGHPLVNPSHIFEDKICVDNELTLTEDKYQELRSYHLQLGDIVLGRRGEMGRCAVVSQAGLLCGTGSLLIRSNEKIEADLLQKIISYPTFKKEIDNVAVGVTMKNLNVPIVSQFKIPLFPLSAQKEYIDFVFSVNNNEEKLQRALSQLELLYKQRMQYYFR